MALLSKKQQAYIFLQTTSNRWKLGLFTGFLSENFSPHPQYKEMSKSTANMLLSWIRIRIYVAEKGQYDQMNASKLLGTFWKIIPVRLPVVIMYILCLTIKYKIVSTWKSPYLVITILYLYKFPWFQNVTNSRILI